MTRTHSIANVLWDGPDNVATWFVHSICAKTAEPVRLPPKEIMTVFVNQVGPENTAKLTSTTATRTHAKMAANVSIKSTILNAIVLEDTTDIFAIVSWS